MDWMTFVVELVKALAWPAVVAIAILVFKDKLLALVDQLTELKGLGMEARFAKDVQDVRISVDAITASVPAVVAPDPPGVSLNLPSPRGGGGGGVDPATDMNNFLIHNLLSAAVNPRDSITRARHNLKGAVAALADHHGLKVSDASSDDAITEMLLIRLTNSGVLTNSARAAGQRLLQLGRDATQSLLSPDFRATIDYVQAVNGFVRMLYGASEIKQ